MGATSREPFSCLTDLRQAVPEPCGILFRLGTQKKLPGGPIEDPAESPDPPEARNYGNQRTPAPKLPGLAQAPRGLVMEPSPWSTTAICDIAPLQKATLDTNKLKRAQIILCLHMCVVRLEIILKV